MSSTTLRPSSGLVRALSGRGGPLRYAAAGLVNSGVGYAVILALGAGGLHPFAANAGGFAAGFLVSLALASAWTFGPAKRPAAPTRYAAAFAACYAGNLGLVAGLLTAGAVAPVAQAGGVGAYAASFYLACRWWVYGDAGDARADARAAWTFTSPRLGILAVLASVPLAVACALIAHTPSDVIWQGWIARQLNGGADLYTDILEVNPPLWFWMAMPVERLTSFVGLAAPVGLKLAAAAYAVVGFALCARLTRPGPDTPGPEAAIDRAVLLTSLLVALFVLPITHFAQREHLALAAALPYLLLASERTRAARVPLWLAVGVGAFAAAGLALKHYFVLIPVLVEAWRLARGGSLGRIVRPETVVLSAAAVCYGLAVLLTSRDFLTEMVPLVRLAYDGYEVRLVAVLAAPAFVASALLVAMIAACARPATVLPSRRLEALGLGYVGFALAYLLQSKALGYQALPLLCIGFAVTCLGFRHVPRGRRRAVLGGLGGALLAASAMQSEQRGAPTRVYPFAAAGIERGDVVLSLSSIASWSLPTAEREGWLWASRSLGLWPMVAHARAQEGGAPYERDEITEIVAAQFAEDARCNPPEFLFADLLLSHVFEDFEGDIVGALGRYEEARMVLAAYEVAAEDYPFVIYRRTAPLPPPPDPSVCRTIR